LEYPVAGGVPHLAFDSADYPPDDGRSRWEALVGAYDVEVSEGQCETDFAVKSQSWLLGDMMVTHGRLTSVRLRRSPERIAADGRDTFTIGLVTRGQLIGDFDGRACELRPGQVCVIDFARPWQAVAAPAEFILVGLSRAPLVSLSPRAGDLHGAVLDGATARIVAEHFAALVRHLPQATAADAPVLQRTTLRMIAGGLSTLTPDESPSSGAAQAGVISRARRYIEAHLDCEDLSPASISSALGVSRATLYRAFRSGGGIAGYIQRRRLEMVHVLLSDPAEARSLAELSLEFGFSSHAHFSTAFRRQFGYTPRDARAGLIMSSAGGAAAQFRSWMLELGAPRVGA
jgi:AraC-like DNA-binding protein